MIPLKYKTSAVGNWQAWTNSVQPDMNTLERQRTEKPESMATGCYVNGTWVYGFDFGGGQEWNVAKGWIKTGEE